MFRGVRNTDHQLIPSAGRLYLRVYKPTGKTFDEFQGHIAAKMQNFSDKALRHWENQPGHLLEEWALAQHHGFPTNFLDWSLNPLVALYFAVNERNEKRPMSKRGDAGVFAFPGNLDLVRPHAPKNKDRDWNAETDVFAYAPRHLAKRISAQDGVFTYHPDPTQIFEPTGLVRFVIPNGARLSILQQLDVVGINEHFVYQDFDGLGAILSQHLGASAE